MDKSEIAKTEGCEKLLLSSLSYGRIVAIYNLAVILQDSIFENQTSEKFIESFLPKANATQFMDRLTRIHCPDLRHFVIFSSASCGRGNAGQSNYGMANAVMERIIENRAKEGLPAKAIQWGAIGEVGLVAEMAQGKVDMEIAGTIQQRISSCLNVMDQLLMTEAPVVSSMVVAQKHVTTKLNLIESVAHIMGIRDIKTVSKSSTLAELGMDSLMAVEIKQALEREFEIFLSAQDLRNLTFMKLQELTDAGKKGDKKSSSQMDPTGDQDLLKNLLFHSLGNEKTSSETLLPMNDLMATPKIYDTCVLIIPGIEGVLSSVHYSLCEQFKLPCYGLQTHKVGDQKTMEGIVGALKKVRKKQSRKMIIIS